MECSVRLFRRSLEKILQRVDDPDADGARWLREQLAMLDAMTDEERAKPQLTNTEEVAARIAHQTELPVQRVWQLIGVLVHPFDLPRLARYFLSAPGLVRPNPVPYGHLCALVHPKLVAGKCPWCGRDVWQT